MTASGGMMAGRSLWPMPMRLQAPSLRALFPPPPIMAKGQVTQIAYGNGVGTAYSCNDARGLLTRVLSTSMLDLTYARNAKGMITGITSADATKSDLRADFGPIFIRAWVS